MRFGNLARTNEAIQNFLNRIVCHLQEKIARREDCEKKANENLINTNDKIANGFAEKELQRDKPRNTFFKRELHDTIWLSNDKENDVEKK